MNTTRGIKLIAMAAITVLALTGFSTGRGHGSSHSRHGSGHGGGCSSSAQRQNGSRASGDDDDDSYGSGYRNGYTSANRRHAPTSGATPAASEPAGGTRSRAVEATLISCVTAGRPWSTVRLRNTGTRAETYTGTVTFYDEDGGFVDLQGIVNERVAKGRTKTVKVKPVDPRGVKRCELTDEEDY
ncbi:hypothetical protein ACQYWQ_07955 [Streptomyces sp. P6-2-1]|uniref:hypothetical protein n=1 Tax=unclassified Streptomyces TaxID=2593676 RepID=UPI003D3678E0